MNRWADMTPEQRKATTERAVRWAQANPERAAVNKRKHHVKNRKKKQTAAAEWQARNPEKARAACKRYYLRYPERALARNAIKRAQKKALTPPLTNEEKARIAGLYAEARAMTEMSGVPYHVDHIKPLSKGGLHHPDNLQVLLGRENLRKGAKYHD